MYPAYEIAFKPNSKFCGAGIKYSFLLITSRVSMTLVCFNKLISVCKLITGTSEFSTRIPLFETTQPIISGRFSNSVIPNTLSQNLEQSFVEIFKPNCFRLHGINSCVIAYKLLVSIQNAIGAVEMVAIIPVFYDVSGK